ncbi:MAG: flagellin [Bryobacteraceae bacterium]|jgi:flagellin
MSISFQTNYASLVAQENLTTNNNFQTQTIEALTSGYRINNSGDDPAGLAVANQYRDSVAELTQGVINGNSALSSLQIMDGGLNNISTMLDRMQTLATESASTSFQGDRGTLDQEFQTLKTEITREATNIGLVAGGANATSQSVYIGGAPTGGSLTSGAVNIDLSAGLVDADSLGLTNSTVTTGGGGTTAGVSAGAALANLTLNKTVALGANPVTFTVYSGNQTAAVSLQGTATVNQFISAINSQIAAAGISGVSADLNATTGSIEFQGTNYVLGPITDAGHNLFLAAGATAAATANGALYTTAAAPWAGTESAAQTLTFTVGGQNQSITLATGTTEAQAVSQINSSMNSLGIYATADGANVYFEGTSPFTVTPGAPGAGTGFTAGAIASTVLNGGTLNSATQNATNAITAIGSALAQLGVVQGTVGAAENDLNYAVSLANSQITNDSSAESQLRDADVATEAANLSKAQVLEQASVAAMAQANATPQAILKLLQ